MLTKRMLNRLMVMIVLLGQLVLPMQNSATAAETNKASIAVQGKEAALLKKKEIEIQEDTDALSLLQETVGSENVKTVDSDYGPMITEIKGLSQEGTFAWAFYVNGKQADVGAHKYNVHADDEILFKYESWNTASLSVFGDTDTGTILDSKKYEINEDTTALTLLKNAVGENNVALKETDYGPMIIGINGLVAEDPYYWAFYVNGKLAEGGAHTYKPQAGDQISFKYESWEQEEKDSGDEQGSQKDKDSPDEGHIVNVNQAVDNLIAYIMEKGVSSEWEAIALHHAGKKIPAGYLDSLKAKVGSSNGEFRIVTDYERMVLGVKAAGGDPTSFAGYNLIEKIYNNERMTNQGTNGVIFGLLALNSGDYNIPVSAEWDQEKLVDYLIENQLDTGGWALYGTTGDPDITAMALSAIAPYKDQEEVKTAIENAVNWLTKQQNANGGFETENGETSESTAEAIIGLTAIGKNPAGASFTKGMDSDVQAASSSSAQSENNLITNLLSFQNEDGGFAHLIGEESNDIASAKGILALVAYQNFVAGKASVYELDRVTVDDTAGDKNGQQGSGGQTQSENESKDGNRLPDTATNTCNLMAIGALLFLTGLFLFFLNRRKRA
ncbi:DUF4430 domain-containing protein [Pseudalkalibacillus caeni]|uniref:DUF4430 domain-containing protein n=1 Tax=Exobacillus caeni TaxID=2574798 RepID=A0A5R9F2Z0_9BACL|nr:DUF4430 domain-containing protein [Pseudalkalibacillus caeni]TLS35918.1 DUF4430 domain-containing protein [Pseudalkalibacillus caeni]